MAKLNVQTQIGNIMVALICIIELHVNQHTGWHNTYMLNKNQDYVINDELIVTLIDSDNNINLQERDMYKRSKNTINLLREARY